MTSAKVTRGAHMRNERKTRMRSQQLHALSDQILESASETLEKWARKRDDDHAEWAEFESQMRQWKRTKNRAELMDVKAEHHTKKQQKVIEE